MTDPAFVPAAGLTMVAFAPSWLGAFARPLGNGRTAPTTADEALAATGAAWVLDGSMFDGCAGLAATQCASPQYGLHDATSGLSLSPAASHDGMTIAVVDGVARAYDGATLPAGATFAAQLYPPLVRAGRVVASLAGTNVQRVWRAALVILRDGRVAFAVGVMDMVAFATALRDAGAIEAGYTDGGGSTRLASTGAHHGNPENRRVATWLVARAPGSMSSAGGAIAKVGALGAIATLAWKYSTGKWPWE